MANKKKGRVYRTTVQYRGEKERPKKRETFSIVVAILYLLR